MVSGMPTIDEVLPKFVSFIQGSIPVAHHAPFDAGFLSYDISRLNLKTDASPILDTCAMPKRLFPEFRSYSLVNLAYALRIESDEFHRALADAKICMEIFLRSVGKLGPINQVTFRDVLAVNGPAMAFNAGEITLDETYKPLKDALENRSSIDIVYRDAWGSVTTRQIMPISIGSYRGTAVVEAMCSLRQDKRTFRLDRILEIH